MRVENIKDPADYLPAVLEKIKPEYIASVYGLSDWTDANDFLMKMATKYGKLLKVKYFHVYCNVPSHSSFIGW